MTDTDDEEITEPIPLYAPERIVLGEPQDGDLAVLVTAAGREAAAAAGLPVDCDLCRRILGTGEEFYRATIGMDDTPDVVGAPAGSHNLVESTSELVFCASCHSQAEALVDGLLDALWALRAPDPELATAAGEEDLPATVKS